MSDGAASGSVPRSVDLPRHRLGTPSLVAAGAVLILALALRLFAARGELWLDELWTLIIIDEAKARHGFLWSLATDNNHYLNTLYLYLVGAHAPTLVQRGLSIALGVATVAAAGAAMRRYGIAATLIAMVLFAVSYPMVNYGSEARGYAGLILATVLAIPLTERAIAGDGSARIRLGLVNAAGMLFQPIMLGSIAALMAWATWTKRPRGGWTRNGILTALDSTRIAFTWTVRILIPLIAFIAVAVIVAGGYRVQGSVPFTAGGFVAGYGGLVRFLLGLPDAVPVWIALLIPIAVVAVLALPGMRRGDHRLSLYAILMIGLPLAMFAARLPNIFFERYYLAPGVALLLALADILARMWQARGVTRPIALLLLAAIAAGSGNQVLQNLGAGRDQSAQIMRTIAADGRALVGSDQDARNQPVVAYFAHRLGLPITYVDFEHICDLKPEWLLSSAGGDDQPDAIDTSNLLPCKRIYRKSVQAQAKGLSGLNWTLYRIEP